jgi:hypothetical protein
MSNKVYGFLDTKYSYNPHWDIAWSFSFALSGTEHGFTSFLSDKTTITSCNGGESLGYYDNSDNPNGVLVVAFDSTGRFALPIGLNPGVSIGEVKPNALIIRDYNNDVVFNQSLSSLAGNMLLTYPEKTFQTIRVRYTNAGRQVSVDYRVGTSNYINLTSISLSSIPLTGTLRPGFTFCSPINNVIDPSIMYVKDFHAQGTTSSPTYETISYVPLSSSIITQYTTISGVLT